MRVYFYVIISWFLRLAPFAPIERSLEKRMMDGGALTSASVRIETTRWGLLFSGWIRAVTVEMEGLRLGGLQTRSFRIRAERFRICPFLVFVRNQVRLREAGEARWTLQIAAEDLQEFFATRGGLWRYTHVTIVDGMVNLRVEGQFADLFRVTPVTVRGGLKLREDGHVDLELEDVRAFGINPGRTLIDHVLNLVNPVIRKGAVNKLLRDNAPEMFAPFVLHNSITEIVTTDCEAAISGEIITFHRETEQQADTG